MSCIVIAITIVVVGDSCRANLFQICEPIFKPHINRLQSNTELCLATHRALRVVRTRQEGVAVKVMEEVVNRVFVPELNFFIGAGGGGGGRSGAYLIA